MGDGCPLEFAGTSQYSAKKGNSCPSKRHYPASHTDHFSGKDIKKEIVSEEHECYTIKAGN
jgi:hypothetical protein